MAESRYNREQSHQEVILQVLRQRGSSYASELRACVRSRIPNRADFYHIMECMERECRVDVMRRNHGILYSLPEEKASARKNPEYVQDGRYAEGAAGRLA